MEVKIVQKNNYNQYGDDITKCNNIDYLLWREIKCKFAVYL